MFATKYKYAFRRLPDLSQFFAEIQFKSHSFSVEILTDFFLGILGNPVVKRRLPHSFDGHRARATSIFSLYFSLRHFNFLLFSIPTFLFSHQYFQTRSSSEIQDNCRKSMYFAAISRPNRDNLRDFANFGRQKR